VLLVPIIGGVVGGIVLILIVTVVVVITFSFVRAKCGLSNHHFGSNDERIYDVPADYEKPIAPPVETIPPKMEMNTAYEQIKTFNMNDNSAYTGVVRI
jgi:hypothetical protein